MFAVRASLLALALAAASLGAQASLVNLTVDEQWHAFTVDALSSDSGGVDWIDADDSLSPGFGSPLTFAFTLTQSAVLRVVDGGFVGDTFRVTVHDGSQSVDHLTSPVAQQALDASFSLLNHGDDFDAAWADIAHVSRTEITLGAGTYTVTGWQLQAVNDLVNGGALTATIGAVSLSAAPVPEPSGLALTLAGLCLAAGLARRSGR